MKNIIEFNHFLNESALFKNKKSKISGTGNFSTQNIKKDTDLGVGLTKIKNTGEPDKDYKRYDICTYTNHSNKPNLYYKKNGKDYHFYTLHDIKKGEELTIDYKKFDFDGIRDFD